jgi:hypothetical protein
MSKCKSNAGSAAMVYVQELWRLVMSEPEEEGCWNVSDTVRDPIDFIYRENDSGVHDDINLRAGPHH